MAYFGLVSLKIKRSMIKRACGHPFILKQANKNLFTACTYDADFITFSLAVEDGKLTVKPLKRISQFCCEYRFVRRLAVNTSNTHLTFLSECVDRQLS